MGELEIFEILEYSTRISNMGKFARIESFMIHSNRRVLNQEVHFRFVSLYSGDEIVKPSP